MWVFFDKEQAGFVNAIRGVTEESGWERIFQITFFFGKFMRKAFGMLKDTAANFNRHDWKLYPFLCIISHIST